jgi:sn-glycerol 3-phosphate transport system substrate-binding protein
MKTKCSGRLWIPVALILLLNFTWRIGEAWAKTEIHFWHAMSGHLNGAVDALAKKFNEKQRDYEVKPLRKGTYPETLMAAIAAYRSKTPPHIVQVFDVGTQTMLLSGTIMPVFQMMKDQRMIIDWNDFIQPVLSYYSKDGRLYSMPFNSSTPILYYNKDAFQKAGLSANRPPTTWKEVGDFSRRIIGVGAAKCGFSTGWPSWILFENMAAWHDLPFATNQNGFGGVDTQLLVNGEFQRKLIGRLVSWQAENIYSYGGRMDLPDPKFTSGECAMYLQSSAVIGEFTRSVPFKWGTGQLPHWGEPYKKATSIPGGATLWVMQGLPPADYRGIAQFFKFLAEPDEQAGWHRATGYVTITNASLKYLGQTNHFLRNPDQWTAFAELTSGHNTPNTQGIRLGNFAAVRDAIEGELENILTRKKSVQQGLDDAVAKGNEILKGFAGLYKESMAHLPAERDPLGLSGRNHEVVVP